MGWDDAPPTKDELVALTWDATPPTPEELKPSYASDVANNAWKEVKAFPGQIPGMAKAGLGIASAPMDALKAIPQMMGGKKLSETNIAEDVNPIIQGNESTLNTIAHPVESFRKAPINTAMTAAGLLGGARGVMAELPEGSPPPEAPTTTPPTPDLPTVEPGAKTGDPHALFAYNDKFGPGGAERSMYNVFGDPEHPAVKQVGWGSSLTADDLQKAGIDITGRQPNSAPYDPVGAEGGKEPLPGTSPEPESDPLKQVSDYINDKYGAASAKPGFKENSAKYLSNLSQQLGAKDLGLQPRQIQSMGSGFKGIEKAQALVDYARDQGYFDPKLTDIARKNKIQATLETSGQQVDAVRSMADTRGSPPVPEIMNQVKAQLLTDYGIDAPREIKKVMLKIDSAPQTFSGMSDLATDLNKAKTNMKSLGQHPGPTTDAANIVSRMNNEAIKKVLNPEEAKMYEDSLRTYGAHKQLEQAVAGAERRGLSARSNQRGIFGRLYQEALDRGGYRIGGNVAHRMAGSMMKNPSASSTLPKFFEELAHHAGDVIDETVEGSGMAYGGIVKEMSGHFKEKYAPR